MSGVWKCAGEDEGRAVDHRRAAGSKLSSEHGQDWNLPAWESGKRQEDSEGGVRGPESSAS